MSQKMKPLPRLFLVGYATVAIGSFAIVFVAYVYAKLDDPYLTPRFTPSQIVYQRVGMTLLPVVSLAHLFGLLLVVTVRELKRSWLMWLSIVLFVLGDLVGFP